MQERSGFTASDIPWPTGVNEILYQVAGHRRSGRSVAGSVALGIVDESHKLSRVTLGLMPRESVLQDIGAHIRATTVGLYYARPAFALLCAEELLKTGQSDPSVLLPGDDLMTSITGFFSENDGSLKEGTREIGRTIERALTVDKANRLVIDRATAEKLPGMEPSEFVDFAMMEEVGILNRMYGMSQAENNLRRVALLKGAMRFDEVYAYALLREP